MPAYFIAIRESVQDPAEMALYVQKARGGNAAFGGQTRVAYGPLTVLEGPPMEGVVILEFPDREQAEAWYNGPAYQEALQHRQRGATFRTCIVDGI
jgi:uncharacterized protein (DUF1330 family)